MQALAHAARLDQRSNPKDANSLTHRQVWEDLAARGDARAVAALEAPSYPDWIHYLREWSDQLYARSGIGMEGIAPLTHVTIVAWRINTGHAPSADEIDALMQLDTVRRDPSTLKADEPKPTRVRRTFYDKWPTRRAKPKASGPKETH